MDTGPDHIVARTHFGTVANGEIVYYLPFWMRVTSNRHVLPLSTIASARWERLHRPLRWVLLWVGLALASMIRVAQDIPAFIAGESWGTVVGVVNTLLPLLLAIWQVWGIRVVVGTTNGSDITIGYGAPWDGQHAETFVATVRGFLKPMVDTGS